MHTHIHTHTHALTWFIYLKVVQGSLISITHGQSTVHEWNVVRGTQYEYSLTIVVVVVVIIVVVIVVVIVVIIVVIFV